MSQLDDLIRQLATNDTKKKLTVGQNIIDFLGDPENSTECEDLSGFIDSLVPWMQSSNFKVSQNGLDIIGLLIERLGSNFKQYVNTVLGAAVDRLGDTREIVREKANCVLSRLMQDVVDPQTLFEKMGQAAFQHKNGKVREEILILLQNTLNQHGAQSLIMSRFLPWIVALLSDPTAPVRDAASNTLVEVYRHIGERVRLDLQKKLNVPPAKLTVLLGRFDSLRASGDMMPSALTSFDAINDGNRGGDDETDRQSVKSGTSNKLRSSSVPANRRNPQTFTAPRPPTEAPSRNSGVRRAPSMRVSSSGGSVSSASGAVGGQAGAVDEELFQQAFEDVKPLNFHSARSLQDELTKIRETLTKTSNDWKVRNDSLQAMRALIVAGASNHEEMLLSLKTMEVPFISSVKDLRSQVVREACITVAFMSQQLRNKVDRFCEALMPSIINLIQNSAKVMATSGIVCMRYIIQNTHSPRFIPIITSYIQSKSREIRRQCCEFLDQMLHTWPTQPLEKHVGLLQEAIRKGISDADPDARSTARKAYWGFADHFKDHADGLLNSLEVTYRRMLQGGEMSNSSSSNSLNTTGRAQSSLSTGAPFKPERSRQSSITSSQENLLSDRKTSTLTRKSSGIPMYTSPVKVDAAALTNGSPRSTPTRSNSAIDAAAVGRANVRAQYAQRNRVLIGASLPRPGESSEKGPLMSGPDSARSTVRSRSRIGAGSGSGVGVSLSQPGSRSTSPTSLKSYHTYFDTPTTPSTTKSSPRKRSVNGPFDDGSDESETSSVCSEKSFDYGRRPSDYGMWGADSRERLHYDALAHDIGEIIANCASTHWADRKDGLIGLQYYFRDGRMLSATELRRVTEIFTRMFMDAHTKVFTLFLDTLTELVVSHKADLGDWLYVLLTRLLNKLGADLLGSIIQKINRTLEVVRESFPYCDQMSVIFKFLVDSTQTPNTKVKIAAMNHLRSIAQHMEPGDVPSNMTLSDQEMPLAKIITLTIEPKSSDVRRSSQAALTSLFTLNGPHFTGILQKLPKAYQENVTEVLAKGLMSMSTIESPTRPIGATVVGDNVGPSPMKPRTLQSPNSVSAAGGGSLPRKSPYRNVPIDPVDDSENLNPEDIQQSLRTTANAIQNYSFDATSNDFKSNLSIDAMIKGSSTTLEEKMALLDLTSTPPRNGDSQLHKNNKENLSKGDDVRLLMSDIIEELQNVKTQSRSTERRACMTQLIRMTREDQAAVIQENFRTVLRLLLENLSDEVGATRALVFGVLTEMLKQSDLISSFQSYTELIILKVLEAHRDSEKDVERAAEGCAAAMAGVLPADTVIRVLNPIIKTGEYPVNQAAIKMMTKVAEHEANREVIAANLGEIMPGLLKAYDNVESSVRKASVFCMVAMHQIAGDQLQPHLSSLNGSKLKLLNLYIKRAQAQQQQLSMPASPRMVTPP